MADARLCECELADFLCALVDDGLVHADGAVAGGIAVHGAAVLHGLLEDCGVIEQIVFALVLMQVGVVVSPAHTEVAFVGHILAAILP